MHRREITRNFGPREEWVDSQIGEMFSFVVGKAVEQLFALHGREAVFGDNGELARAYSAFMRSCHADEGLSIEILKEKFNELVPLLKAAVSRSTQVASLSLYREGKANADRALIFNEDFDTLYAHAREKLRGEYYRTAWEATAGSVVMGDLNWKQTINQLLEDDRQVVLRIVRELLMSCVFNSSLDDGEQTYEKAGIIFNGTPDAQILQLCSTSNEALLAVMEDEPAKEALLHLRSSIECNGGKGPDTAQGLERIPQAVEDRIAWAHALIREAELEAASPPQLTLI